MYPEQRLRGVFKEIYDKQERPTEEIALDNLDKVSIVKRLIKWAGGIIEEP